VIDLESDVIDEALIDELAGSLLCNPVIEDYTWQVAEPADAENVA
jgi:phosphoribosylformylglycinamidine (FGAM) synthase PurS component